MVSLEHRSSYLSGISTNTKLKMFHDFIYCQPFAIPEGELKEIDKIYFSVLYAISQSDKAEFDKIYIQVSKRKVTAESPAPFIHDDALMFALILGVHRFGHNTDWIQQILDIRSTSETTSTFKSLLIQDYFNKSNLHQIVVPFLQLLKSETPSEVYINDTYRTLITNHSLFENRSDFLILLSLNAFDWIILSKNTEEGALEKLKNFETKFLKRTRWLSVVSYNLVLITLTYGIWKVLSLFPEIKEKFSDVATIIGFIGIQVLGNLITILRTTVENVIRRTLGYNQAI